MSGRALACCGVAILSLATPQPVPHRMLFIGNSLVLANGLGGMVEALARTAGDPPVHTRTVAVGGYSLADHWSQGPARQALASGGWTVVVLQQGPSTQPDSEAQLRDYVRRFSREAARGGARTAVFMAWPPRRGPGTFADSSRAYRHANQDVDGLLLPVGDALQAALAGDPDAPIFSADGFHPAPLGTYLAAIVVHRAISGRPAPWVPASLDSPDGAFPAIQLSRPTVDLVTAAASATAR